MLAKIIHLTSAHPRNDTRILLKECTSLAAHGYDVTLVVADGQGEEAVNGVRVVDIGPKGTSRLKRMLKTTGMVFRKAMELDADIYHLHDPELLPVGLRLKRRGKRVIFDSHEHVARQIMGKYYLAKWLRPIVARMYQAFEFFAVKRVDAVVAARPDVLEHFDGRTKCSVGVFNYPMLEELWAEIADEARDRIICYVGGMTRIRGLKELVQAMEFVNGELHLAGKISESDLEEELKTLAGWSKVVQRGFLNRQEVGSLLSRSALGVVTFLPAPNHMLCQPTKLFEYISAGLPVVASDFPLIRQIIEEDECGICVDPSDPQAIAAAINSLLDDPEKARRLGENGRRAVETKYNWQTEERKLFALYERLLKADGQQNCVERE